jgi:mono/diheme cytochrome c family protein
VKKSNLVIMILMLGLAACSGTTSEETASPEQEVTIVETATSEAPSRMGMGPGSGMMERHRAPIPSEYAGLANPVPADDESLARGSELYTANCATCHGDGGMGDGPAGVALDPVPASIAHTSQMMGDDYLFYRISEGGAFEPFNSSMIAWKSVLDEESRWDVINYVRALGSGQVMPGRNMGGMAFDPEAEAAKHEEMAEQGVEQGVITQEEADTFLEVHTELDVLLVSDMERMGGMEDMQATMLGELVESDRITKKQADTFAKVHDALIAAGLME